MGYEPLVHFFCPQVGYYTPTSMNMPVQDNMIMTEVEWRESIRHHRRKLSPVVNAHLLRAASGEPHPVIDFLFQYYPFAPAHLMRWTPGWGVRLVGEIPAELCALKETLPAPGIWQLDPVKFPQRRREAAGWVLKLLEATQTRSPRYGCFGLHEWAMVYQSRDVRHMQVPLRFSVDDTARIVESLPINCSHYDAFRFFTPEARPLNRLQPALEKRQDLEQRGCLHVNMDLYKWATQFYPWISSDIIADCFLLALKIREVDMRASPYDLSSLGLSPIRIETEEGRAEYVKYQQTFAEDAVPLRARLIKAFRSLREMPTM
jgi:hypothetical protein